MFAGSLANMNAENLGPREPEPQDPYEQRPGYVTELDGRNDRTPKSVAIGVGVGVISLFIFGLLHVIQWIAFPGAILIAIAVWQLLAFRTRTRKTRK